MKNKIWLLTISILSLLVSCTGRKTNDANTIINNISTNNSVSEETDIKQDTFIYSNLNDILLDVCELDIISFSKIKGIDAVFINILNTEHNDISGKYILLPLNKGDKNKELGIEIVYINDGYEFYQINNIFERDFKFSYKENIKNKFVLKHDITIYNSVNGLFMLSEQTGDGDCTFYKLEKI